MINHIEQNPNDSLAAMYNLRNDMAEGFIQMGQLLSHIKQTKLYRFKGYETFKDYLETEHNMKSALANKLIRVHRLFVDEMDTDEYTLKAIGLDRLDMIAPMLNNADWLHQEELLKMAEALPIPELEQELKKLKEAENMKVPDLKKILIDQFKEQMCNLFNTSWSEVIFKLALFFTTPTKTDPIYLHAMKKDVMFLQRQFEESISEKGPDIFSGSGAFQSSESSTNSSADILSANEISGAKDEN